MAKEVFFQDKSAVTIDGESHPISFGEVLRPNSEYNIALYVFDDEFGQRSDGCVFEISPRGSTTVMRIVEPDFVCQRIAINGSGWFLGMSPIGEVICQRIDAKEEENPLIELSAGWVDCWIADDGGAEIADISTPPFSPNMEKEITLDDPSLPVEFWRKYKTLKHLV